MENRSHALMAGLFVLLLGCATAAAIWFFGGTREDTNTYVLETRKNVTGLNTQAQVRYRGIRAGKVESITLDERNPQIILVKISLDTSYRLTKATTARLGFLGVTGLAYVQLEDDGTSREFLDPGAAAPPRITLQSTYFDTLGDKAGQVVEQISELSLRLTRLLDDKNVDNLTRTLENAAAASESLKQVPEIVAALRAAVAPANLRRLDAILVDLEKTAGAAAPLTIEARALVKSMTALSARLDHVVGDTGSRFSAATLPRIEALIGDLGANSRQLSRLLESVEENPQALIFGKGAAAPGPGEPGFVAPAALEK